MLSDYVICVSVRPASAYCGRCSCVSLVSAERHCVLSSCILTPPLSLFLNTHYTVGSPHVRGSAASWDMWPRALKVSDVDLEIQYSITFG